MDVGTDHAGGGVAPLVLDGPHERRVPAVGDVVDVDEGQALVGHDAPVLPEPVILVVVARADDRQAVAREEQLSRLVFALVLDARDHPGLLGGPGPQDDHRAARDGVDVLAVVLDDVGLVHPLHLDVGAGVFRDSGRSPRLRPKTARPCRRGACPRSRPSPGRSGTLRRIPRPTGRWAASPPRVRPPPPLPHPGSAAQGRRRYEQGQYRCQHSVISPHGQPPVVSARVLSFNH